MSLTSSNRRVILLAILFMALAWISRSHSHLADVAAGHFTNSDSYYKLVLLEGHSNNFPINFNPRDTPPYGSWIHWSLPHSWTLWQLHKIFWLLGLETRQALIWAGASLTLLSMLLLAALVSGVVLNVSTRKATLVAAVALATNLPVSGYGQVQQITHHIFMLVPLAGAALCVSRLAVARNPYRDSLGGALAGLALWISPETMPLVVILVAVRIAIRVQFPATGELWPVAIGLVGIVMLAREIDPPPPTFPAWALDHVSLAWVLFACLTGLLLLVADILVAFHRRLPVCLLLLSAAGLTISAVWLGVTPGALEGPTGLLPAELKLIWWDNIQELGAIHKPEEFISYLMLPLLSGALCTYWSYRKKILWLGALGAGTLLYALLGAMHMRMGAAAASISVVAFGASLACFPAFSDHEDSSSLNEQILGALLALVGPLQIILVALVLPPINEQDETNKANNCAMADYSDFLNTLPPSVFLTTANDAPELLYRTHHKVISGNYHHNVSGLLDLHRALRDTAPWTALFDTLKRRSVDYVLICGQQNTTPPGTVPPPTAQRVLSESGEIKNLEPITSEAGKSSWRLYRVIKDQP